MCVLDPPREDTRAGRRVTAPRAGGGQPQRRQGAAHRMAHRRRSGAGARARPAGRAAGPAHTRIWPRQVPAAWVSGVFYIS